METSPCCCSQKIRGHFDSQTLKSIIFTDMFFFFIYAIFFGNKYIIEDIPFKVGTKLLYNPLL